jgi:Multiubiquitin
MSDHSHEQHKVRIHISGKAYESPSPTTDDALYALARVPAELELFRETEGDREDVPVPRGAHEIHLKMDEHFYAGLEWTIIVEGTPHEWPKAKITYAEVVTLFDPEYPQHPEMTYRVMWEDGPAHKPEGTLVLGASVKIVNEMVFHVSPTGQS